MRRDGMAGSTGGCPRRGARRAISRRGVLRGAAMGTGAAALLAACSSGGTSNDAATTDTSSRAPGVTATAAAADVKPGGELLYAATRDATTLDGHVGVFGDETYIYYGIYDTSLSYNDEAQLIPLLAESFE